MESMKEITRKVVQMADERQARFLRSAAANVDKLKAERGSAEHDLEMHKETCEHCRKQTTEQLSACFGCDLGSVLAKIYQQKSRALRGAE